MVFSLSCLSICLGLFIIFVLYIQLMFVKEKIQKQCQHESEKNSEIHFCEYVFLVNLINVIIKSINIIAR